MHQLPEALGPHLRIGRDINDTLKKEYHSRSTVLASTVVASRPRQDLSHTKGRGLAERPVEDANQAGKNIRD